MAVRKLDDRKRVYIDRQTPSVSPLNIYSGQEPEVKLHRPRAPACEITRK